MRKSEAIEFHEREAARCRRLLASATTPALRARLTEQANEYERFGEQLDFGGGSHEAMAPVVERLAGT